MKFDLEVAYLNQIQRLAEQRAAHDQSLPADTRADFAYIARYAIAIRAALEKDRRNGHAQNGPVTPVQT